MKASSDHLKFLDVHCTIDADFFLSFLACSYCQICNFHFILRVHVQLRSLLNFTDFHNWIYEIYMYNSSSTVYTLHILSSISIESSMSIQTYYYFGLGFISGFSVSSDGPVFPIVCRVCGITKV